MNIDILTLFDKSPAMLPLYALLEERIMTEFEGVSIKTGKTQVSFYNRHGFAWASLPHRKIKGISGECMIVTFGLGEQVTHERIYVATQPYPNRWTHHVIVQSAKDIDQELMNWIGESYRFSLGKR